MARKMKLKISARFMRKKNRRASYGVKKHCRFCGSLQTAAELDYKNAALLKNFLTERGKILPSRISGNCARHQRILTNAIKNARIMALVAYTSPHY